MPYIEQPDRDKFIHEECGGMQTLNSVDEIKVVADKIETCGELNYVITRLCQLYTKNKGLRYQQINDVLGALDGASKEYYRRVAVPYEDKKIEQNGDVYELDD